ncbi:hypothetical protein THL1_611 [Pseudomonas sp. TCU-HL1]|nr:hypothetical protein THL1_611 [Pseudomonas sp. TCU-HL1]
MGDIDEIQSLTEQGKIKNVEFIAVNPNSLSRLLNSTNRSGLIPYSFYLAYKNWHKQAYTVAKNIIRQTEIDLVHFLCPIGYREPGYLWGLNKPYIWGPIGGVQNPPLKLAFKASIATGLKVLIKSSINTLQFNHSPRIKNAFHKADLILSATSATKELIRQKHGIETICFPENAITNQMLISQKTINVNSGDTINLIWVGRIDSNKSLSLLIESLSLIKEKNWHLYVIGDGPLKKPLSFLAEQLGIEKNITWTGNIQRNKVNYYYSIAHIHSITSLAEGNPTVIWEAMSHGIPTITLDHCGMHDTVCDQCGVKIEISTYDKIIKEYGMHLEELIESPEKINRLSEGVNKCVEKFTWEKRVQLWTNLYDLAIQKRQKKNLMQE